MKFNMCAVYLQPIFALKAAQGRKPTKIRQLEYTTDYSQFLLPNSEAKNSGLGVDLCPIEYLVLFQENWHDWR